MTLVWVLAGLVALAALAAFLVAPGRMPAATRKTALLFDGLNCAHRGLHREDQTVPENSLPAFAAARAAGYGVELDVQLSKDGRVVVFHDDDLARVCGVNARVDAFDWEALRTLKLFETGESIPLFSRVLEALEAAPVIVELKSAGPRNAELCQKTLRILRGQGTAWCVESFDPRIVAWFRKNAPDALRGQLSRPPKGFTTLPRPMGLALGNLLTNVLARPHFIAYDTSPRPLTVRLCHAMRPMRAVWTVHPDMDIPRCERENNTVIFEYYTPPPKFRRG